MLSRVRRTNFKPRRYIFRYRDVASQPLANGGLMPIQKPPELALPPAQLVEALPQLLRCHAYTSV